MASGLQERGGVTERAWEMDTRQHSTFMMLYVRRKVCRSRAWRAYGRVKYTNSVDFSVRENREKALSLGT